MKVVYVLIAEHKYRAGSGFLYTVSCQENRSWSQRYLEHHTGNLMHEPLVLTFHHNFTRLLEGRAIRHEKEKKDSSPAETF